MIPPSEIRKRICAEWSKEKGEKPDAKWADIAALAVSQVINEDLDRAVRQLCRSINFIRT